MKVILKDHTMVNNSEDSKISFLFFDIVYNDFFYLVMKIINLSIAKDTAENIVLGF